MRVYTVLHECGSDYSLVGSVHYFKINLLRLCAIVWTMLLMITKIRSFQNIKCSMEIELNI